MRKVTLMDIAKELGISKGTVDRAVHDRPDINPETRQKVLDLMKKYDYRPDKVARSLSLKKKKIRIGIVTPAFPEFFWNNIERGIRAAEVELVDFGLEIVHMRLPESRETKEVVKKLQELEEENVDGIILVPVNSSLVRAGIRKASEDGIVVATLNDDITDSGRAFYIGPQLKQSGRIAGELIGKFLRSRGRVVTISCELDSLDYHERLEGFIEVLKERFGDIDLVANYRFSPEVISGNKENAVSNLLEGSGDIDAIYNIDGASLYNIGCIIKNSSKLNKTVLVGHEISKDVRDMLEDGTIYACISQDPYFQGYFAVKIMYEYLAEGKKPSSDRIYTRADVILRENSVNWDTGLSLYIK